MAKTLAQQLLNEDYVNIERLRQRLDELDRPVFDVYRTKNEQVLVTLDSRSEAEEYVTDNDYDPERVKVRENVSSLVSDENRTEVAGLRKIRDAVVAARGQEGWDSGSQSLYKLVPGTEVIEVGGERIVFLEALFSRF